MTGVLQWPDKRLSRAAEPVPEITDEIHGIWDRMTDVMEAMPGVGLAAPQLGVMLRLAVVDASEERGRAILMANPEILQASSELFRHTEASPCLPGVSAVLERPKTVTVRFLNERGIVDRRELTGLWSTSIQHQIDHLNGKLFFDRLSPTKRKMLLKKAEKARRRS